MSRCARCLKEFATLAGAANEGAHACTPTPRWREMEERIAELERDDSNASLLKASNLIHAIRKLARGGISQDPEGPGSMEELGSMNAFIDVMNLIDSSQPPLPVYGPNERIAELEDVLHRIRTWCDAYPLDVFPEPDLVAVRAALAAQEITLDSVAASNMRHVLTRLREDVGGALDSES